MIMIIVLIVVKIYWGFILCQALGQLCIIINPYNGLQKKSSFYLYFTCDETEHRDMEWLRSHIACVRVEIKPKSFWFQSLCLFHIMVKRLSGPELPIPYMFLVFPLISALCFSAEGSLSLNLHHAVCIFHIPFMRIYCYCKSLQLQPVLSGK